eukprot:COSAG02_NODE_23757_length_709_cov_0.950820_1_plen_199_part_10
MVSLRRYVKNTWVPDTLSALTDEKLHLESRNAGLGLPAAHGNTGDVGVLRALREAACASIKSALQQVLPGIIEHFAQKIKQLDQQVLGALQDSKVTDIVGVEPHLAEMKVAAFSVYSAANEGVDATLVQQLQEALQQHFSEWRVGQQVTNVRKLTYESMTLPKWDVGTVVEVMPDGMLRVEFRSGTWKIVPACVGPIAP